LIFGLGNLFFQLVFFLVLLVLVDILFEFSRRGAREDPVRRLGDRRIRV
jgi:hypothetical protein